MQDNQQKGRGKLRHIEVYSKIVIDCQSASAWSLAPS